MTVCWYLRLATSSAALLLAALAPSLAREPEPPADAPAQSIAVKRKAEYEKAMAECTEAIRLKPQFALAYCGRGCAYSDQGELAKAIADQTEAIRLDSELAVAYYHRGSAYEKEGQTAKAKQDFDQAKNLGYKPD